MQIFLKCKRINDVPSGIEPVQKIQDALFPFQRDLVKWALRRGRATVFAECGLGKTIIEA